MLVDKNTLKERFKNENLIFKVLKNNQLTCKDCKLRYNDDALDCNTSRCEIFQIKPDEVLNGGDCDEKVRE